MSVMFANNEIGVIQPIREIGELCHQQGVLFHCDAAQAFGKVPIRVLDDQIDLMSLSAHKMYGPKGVGALYVRRRNPRVPLAIQMDGGGHEYGMRSGTLNVPAIVGFGEACAIAGREMEEEGKRLAGIARPTFGASGGGAGPRVRERLAGTSAARQSERELRGGGRRVATDEPAGRGALDRVGVHLGHRRAEPRAEGAWRGRGTGALLAALRVGTLQYGGRTGLRGGARGGIGAQTPGAGACLSAVQIGEGEMFGRCLGLLVLLAGVAGAQSSNGYVFFAPGGVSCCGYTAMTLHFGVGGEAVLGKGVGIGAEIGALGTRAEFADAVEGVFSANGYYHFAHRKASRWIRS